MNMKTSILPGVFAQNVARFAYAIVSILFLVRIQQISWSYNPQT